MTKEREEKRYGGKTAIKRRGTKKKKKKIEAKKASK